MHACTVLCEVTMGKLCVYQLLYITKHVAVVDGACGSVEKQRAVEMLYRRQFAGLAGG